MHKKISGYETGISFIVVGLLIFGFELELQSMILISAVLLIATGTGSIWYSLKK